MTALSAAELAEYARARAAEAPPIPAESRAVLRDLLRPGAAPPRRRRAA